MAKSEYVKGSAILWEDHERVAVVTGLKRKSANGKTGGMAQIWFISKHDNPVTAIRDGNDRKVCFDCALRFDPVTKKRACYVKTFQAPRSVWRAYNAGRYRYLQDYRVFAGRKVRFGAYGEPVLLPMPIVKAIAGQAMGWTGYTHQWASPLYQGYRRYFMASTDLTNFEHAQSLGWRTFTVTPKGLQLSGQFVCPASKEAGQRTTCERCLLCSGTAKNARSGQIQEHA